MKNDAHSFVEEHQHEGDIVDHRVILHSPPLIGQLQHRIAALLQLALLVVRHHQLQDLVILDELPHPVRRDQQKLVPLLQLQLKQLRLMCHSYQF